MGMYLHMKSIFTLRFIFKLLRRITYNQCKAHKHPGNLGYIGVGPSWVQGLSQHRR